MAHRITAMIVPNISWIIVFQGMPSFCKYRMAYITGTIVMFRAENSMDYRPSGNVITQGPSFLKCRMTQRTTGTIVVS
jgi:hypothetical protein